MSKTTQYGVKVSTWGTHVNGGNGILSFLDANLFGGNIGHASVTLTLPADDSKTQALLDKYCKKPKIPFKKKKIIVQQAVLDPLTGKLKKDETVAHEEEVYEVYFSWWGPEDKDKKKGRFYNLSKNMLEDNENERDGVNFEWNSKAIAYINPDRRRYRKPLGEREMMLGPLAVVHGRELTDEEQRQIAYRTSRTRIDEDVDSLKILSQKLDGKKILEKKLEKEDGELKIGSSLKGLLSRFIPKWELRVKNPKLLTNEERVMLLNELKQKKDDYEIRVGFTEKNLLDKFIPGWESKVKNPRLLTDEERTMLAQEVKKKIADYERAWDEMSDLNKLLYFQDAVLSKISTPPVDQQFLREIIEAFGKSVEDKDMNVEMAEILGDTYDTMLKNMREGRVVSDIDIAQLSSGLAEVTKNIKEHIRSASPSIEFPLRSFDMKKELNERYVVKGKPADHTITLPLSNDSFPGLGIGHENGLDPEEMLKKMQELAQLDAGGYKKVTKNCSKTVGAILETGAKQPELKKIFQNKAFGFFGTPQEVYNNAIEVQHVIYSNRSKARNLLTRLNVSPIEAIGGYLIGVLLEPSGRLKKTGVILAGIIIAPLALASFTVRKLLNPLNSFKGTIGLIKFTFSRNSKVLRGLAVVMLTPVAIVLAPLAAVQFSVTIVLINPIKRLLEPSNKKLARLEGEIKGQKTSKQIEHQAQENAIIKRINKQFIIELSPSDPKDALQALRKELNEDSESIPILTKKASQELMKYLKTRPVEADAYQEICKETHKRFLLARKLVQTDLAAAALKPKETSKNVMMFSKPITSKATLTSEEGSAARVQQLTSLEKESTVEAYQLSSAEEIRQLKTHLKAVRHSLEKREHTLKLKLHSALPGKLYHLLHKHHKKNQAELKIIGDLKSVVDNVILDYKSHLQSNGSTKKEIMGKKQLISLLESSVEQQIALGKKPNPVVQEAIKEIKKALEGPRFTI